MPEMPAPQGAVPQPPGSPGQSPGQPPPGASPATGPTQNRGYEVAAQKLVGLALIVLEQAGPVAGANTDMGREIYKSISGLAKMVPPGTVTPADIKNVAEQVLMKTQQFQGQMQQMRGAQGAPQGAPQGQPGAAQMARPAA